MATVKVARKTTKTPGKTKAAKTTTTKTAPPRRSFPADTAPPGKVMLSSDTGAKLVLPFAPREVEHAGLADKWDTIDRPRRRPLVRWAATGLPTMSFDVLIARADWQQSVEDVIADLRRLATGDARVIVYGAGPNERGPWHLTGLTVKSTHRQDGTNAITRATASLDFTLAVDVTIAGVRKPPAAKGPASGGSKRPAPANPKGLATPKTHTVKKGDTLQSIADRYYGVPSKWRLIADANPKTVRDPHWIYPGQRLTIPPVNAAKAPTRSSTPTRKK